MNLEELTILFRKKVVWYPPGSLDKDYARDVLFTLTGWLWQSTASSEFRMPGPGNSGKTGYFTVIDILKFSVIKKKFPAVYWHIQ